LRATGTNTDSVIIDITQRDDPTTRGVIASFKHATTPNVTTGIEGAVREVLQASGIDPGCEDILGLTIGTTVGFQNLQRICVAGSYFFCFYFSKFLAFYQRRRPIGFYTIGEGGRYPSRSPVYD
jgi:hypothetical protein